MSRMLKNLIQKSITPNENILEKNEMLILQCKMDNEFYEVKKENSFVK